MRQVRTDLASESAEARGGESIPGVQVSGWETGGVEVTEVRVETEEGARLLGKDIGIYISLECEAARKGDPEGRQAMSSLLSEEIQRMLPGEYGEGEGTLLVVGLGNRGVTPDALGPMVAQRTLVTRHIFRELPDSVDERMRSVCAVAPGVLGVTGVETSEVISGLVEKVRPLAVLCVDSLAARSVKRLGNAVQLTDTGIRPGSGVGNHRKALTKETLGVPVLALGVPTVIYATTIVRDALEMLENTDASKAEEIDHAVLDSDIGEMIVTPREVDELIDDISHMLACGINQAAHPGLTEKEILTMMGE